MISQQGLMPEGKGISGAGKSAAVGVADGESSSGSAFDKISAKIAAPPQMTQSSKDEDWD